MMHSFGSVFGASRWWIAALAIGAMLPGCTPEPAPSAADSEIKTDADQRPLRLLVFDDPQLAETIEREWIARGGASLTVENAEASSFKEKTRLRADAVIYPANLLGELAERNLLAPLSSEQLSNPEYDRQDILPMPRLRDGAWGGKTLALPFGSPTFVLYYRQDIFDALQLQPPATWAEYADVSKRLADRAALAEAGIETPKEWRATAEPWGGGWASRVFLARAAAYAAHPREFSCLFDVDTFATLLTQPPFVRALEEMRNAVNLSPPEATSWSPGEVRKAFHRGRCGMALTWPHHEREGAAQEPAGWTQPTGIVEAPGAGSVYSFGLKEWAPRSKKHVPLLGVAGRLGSITRASGNRAGALRLLTWASGPEMSVAISTNSSATTVFRQSHLSAPAAWVESNLSPSAVQDYVSAVEAVNARRQWLHLLRIPGANDYLAALDAEIRLALASDKTPAAALAAAAGQWQNITEQRGLKKQTQAYRRNFGLSR